MTFDNVRWHLLWESLLVNSLCVSMLRTNCERRTGIPMRKAKSGHQSVDKSKTRMPKMKAYPCCLWMRRCCGRNLRITLMAELNCRARGSQSVSNLFTTSSGTISAHWISSRPMNMRKASIVLPKCATLRVGVESLLALNPRDTRIHTYDKSNCSTFLQILTKVVYSCVQWFIVMYALCIFRE